MMLKLIPCTVRDLSPGLEAIIGYCGFPLPVKTKVTDGLTCFSERATVHGMMNDAFEKQECGVLNAELFEKATAVRDIKPPRIREAGIRCGNLITIPQVRFFSLPSDRVFIRGVDLLRHRLPAVRNGGRFLFKEQFVKEWTSGAIDLPHMRIGMDAASLTDEARRSFLQEAETVKHISADQSELLTVFYHVPIEMISRLRFIDDKKMLLYRISPGLRRTQTRVYDMAAVRDIAGRKTHLITHRSRCRVLSLN
ncbi:MAG TPA: hypothetical protein VLL97_03515 [Acidobacteriota bacterium]|nr:hypothetical protein [Acidobacteriota bacterium]